MTNNKLIVSSAVEIVNACKRKSPQTDGDSRAFSKHVLVSTTTDNITGYRRAVNYQSSRYVDRKSLKLSKSSCLFLLIASTSDLLNAVGVLL